MVVGLGTVLQLEQACDLTEPLYNNNNISTVKFPLVIIEQNTKQVCL